MKKYFLLDLIGYIVIYTVITLTIFCVLITILMFLSL